MKTTKILSLLFVAVMAFSACKKDPVTGPAGPTGPQGPTGNANVKSSSVSSSAWTFVSPSWEQAFTYPAITQDILDKGAVICYVQQGSNYYQLPYTFYPSSAYSRTYSFVHYLGGFKVYVTDSDLTQPTNPGSLTFKVVVIEASGLAAHPELDLYNYEDVKKAYNLKD